MRIDVQVVRDRVHLYHEVTTEELYDIVVNHCQDIVACAREIAAYVENLAD